jgi:hypothetical protein
MVTMPMAPNRIPIGLQPNFSAIMRGRATPKIKPMIPNTCLKADTLARSSRAGYISGNNAVQLSTTIVNNPSNKNMTTKYHINRDFSAPAG